MKALQFLQVAVLILGSVYLLVLHLNNANVVVLLEAWVLGRFLSPVTLVLFLAFLFGLLYGLLLTAPSLVRRSVQMRQMNKRIRELENQLTKQKPAETPRIPDRAETLEALRSEGKM
ncbi:MAG: lipopolysaccharide assembly protein LapA domain-containing protein [Deinococcales bacterium]